LGNNQGNLQLHRFTRRENTAKKVFGVATFLTHTVEYLYASVAVGRGSEDKQSQCDCASDTD